MKPLRFCSTLLFLGNLACPPKAVPEPAGAALDAGLPQAPGSPQASAPEVEPNDTPQTAQAVTHSIRVRGELTAVQPGAHPDEDWFLLQPTQPQDVALSLSGFEGRLLLEVYDRDHNKRIVLSGLPPIAIPDLRVRDSLLLRVAFPSASTGAASQAYQLDFKFSDPDPDAEGEPNNRAVDATPLLFDRPLKGTLGVEGDQDFYLVSLQADGGLADAGSSTAPKSDGGNDSASVAIDAGASPAEMLRVEVTGVANLRWSLTILDQALAPVAQFLGHVTGGRLQVRDFPVPLGAGQLTLLLESVAVKQRHPFSSDPYRISVHREPAPAGLELEPNDTASQATPLMNTPSLRPNDGPSWVPRVGYLAPEGDVDYFEFTLAAPARLHAVVSQLERVDTELSLFSADGGRPLIRVNEGGTKEPEVIPGMTLAAGSYLLRVQAAAHQVGQQWVRDQSDPEQPYRLQVSTAPDDGAFEREPNDLPTEATPLQAGETVSGYAFPSKDVDFYSIDLTAQPVAVGAHFRLSGVSKVPLGLALYESGAASRVGELLNSSDPGKAGMAAELQQKLSPGIYYLKVQARPLAHTAGVPQSDPDQPYQVSFQID